MRTLSLIGFGLWTVTSTVVGLRLLATAMRSSRMPELAMGISFFAGGGFGYALAVLPIATPIFPPSIAPVVLLLGNTAMMAGLVALALGIWRIFRPAELWPLALVAGIVVLAGISLSERVLHVAELPARRLVFWPFILASATTYAWGGFESLRFLAKLRRRARIGLGGREMEFRFLLWGISGVASVGVHACVIGNRLLDPMAIAPPLLTLQGILSLGIAVTIWFAFFPPRRMRMRAASSA